MASDSCHTQHVACSSHMGTSEFLGFIVIIFCQRKELRTQASHYGEYSRDGRMIPKNPVVLRFDKN